MSWRNIKLVFLRELRDQLRDRRTLFTVLVLPMLLYPFIGMTFLQVSQFMREHTTSIWIVGYDPEQVSTDPPLLVDGTINSDLIDQRQLDLLQLRIESEIPESLQAYVQELEQQTAADGEDRPSPLLELLAQERVDLLVLFPKDDSSEASAGEGDASLSTSGELDFVPTPRVLMTGNLARDASRVARQRMSDVLDRWRTQIITRTLARNRVPEAATRPFVLQEHDLSQVSTRQAMLWSKILPFVMLLWALTGAFYPAIDSCAGEKERGTLETMLCGPAARSEIVAGKLLTIISFSSLTSLLNLLSMMVSGFLLIRAMPSEGLFSIGPPPLLALFWLVLALIPAATLFGSLALSIAVFARSTKEGQYYLMPLLLISLPLLMIALMPASELEFGTAIIPLTGLMLLLRELIEGDYSAALTYAAPVLMITLAAVYFSTRWAVAQFNNESVIFRESEQVGVGLWLKHLARNRQHLPSVGEALLCGVLILLIRFFGSLMLPPPSHWSDFATTTAITLLAFIATPALLMALMLTRRPGQTLLLRYPGVSALLMAPLIAICLHPAMMAVAKLVTTVYKPSPEFAALDEMIKRFFGEAGSIVPILLVIAATPAICEELAFRGFILTGLSQLKNKFAAIGLSAFLFGVAHGVLQQSITATITGLVLGYVAYQTRSLFPVILYHFTHNSLSVFQGYAEIKPGELPGIITWWIGFEKNVGVAGHMQETLLAIALGIAGFGALIALYFWNPTHRLDDPAVSNEPNS